MIKTAFFLISALFIGTANANTWTFNYSGGGVSASGSFMTAGSAFTPELVSNFTGTYTDSFVNNAAITGLVSLGADPHWLYDNKFTAVDPLLNRLGILFGVVGLGSNVNIFFNDGTNHIPSDFGQYLSGTYVGGRYQLQSVNLVVSAVPEPEIYAMLLAGLGLFGFMACRRKNLDA